MFEVQTYSSFQGQAMRDYLNGQLEEQLARDNVMRVQSWWIVVRVWQEYHLASQPTWS